MKLKNLMMAATATVAMTFGAASQAAPVGFAECVSESFVSFPGNVVEAAVAAPELSTLVTALTEAGLVETLANAEDITVYAPTNDAFAAIPADILNAILADVDLLTNVLIYHVTQGINDPRSFVHPVRRNTLLGQQVYYAYNDAAARVNNAAVECTGVNATNGRIWIIGSVLFPNL
ncbi:MAG: fasciclin domain-containing protein [Pseudomonadota bacterium]